jgi:glycosyltransferase involved in cell wall biosynthesis
MMDVHTSVHRPMLSVVAPCFNEGACLPRFLDRMIAACQTSANGSHEIILVNDGSTDNTWACIRAMALTRPGVVAINLSRNHGHQLAVTAGLSRAKGDRVLVIDADLQDPPELLGEMMARMDQAFDVVYGRRRTRAGEGGFKRTTAHIFYRLLGRVSDVAIPMDTGDFRLLSRSMVERLNAMPEQDRFLRGMVAWLGGRQSEVIYDRDRRFAGNTGYTLMKMVKLAMAGLTSFSTVPLRLAAILTMFGMFIGCAVALYAVAGRLLGNVVPGWTSLALVMVFFSTAQLACLAVMSVYVGRIFMQVKQRPLFLIDEVVTTDARVALAPSSASLAMIKDRDVAAR